MPPAAPRPGRSRPYHASAAGRQPLAELAAAGVVVVEHDPSVRRGQLREPRLDGPVRLDAAVAVEVVLGDVRVQRDVGAAADRRQLQLGELEHDPVVRRRARVDRSISGVPMLPPRTVGQAALGSSIAASSEAVVVLPFVPVTPASRAPGEAQEEVDLADDLGAARLGVRQRLAQPRIGGREAGRDRRAGHQQVGVLEQCAPRRPRRRRAPGAPAGRRGPRSPRPSSAAGRRS